MAGTEAPKTLPLGALQSQHDSLRRARPPDINAIGGDENRIPLRADRMARGESKLNLRGLFGRAKTSKIVRGSESTSSLHELSWSGKRVSLAEIGNWPYASKTHQSECSLLGPPLSASGSPPVPVRQSQQPHSVAGNAAPQAPPGHLRRSSTAIPLFQVYPQAVKHATLSCCTTPAESLLRLNATKGSLPNVVVSSQSSSPLDLEEAGSEKRSEGVKKRALRNAGLKSTLEWTSKIYVLVTSGYLLQYAAEGPFDRIPEKSLQLTKDSAVFASDLIPGRHWVLQVASSTDPNGNPTTDARSIRSKFPFRNYGKRQVTNILLVFESAESMDSWLATLRREIRSLGGKKKLSETGNPDAENEPDEVEVKPRRRTLVVRDPDQFSRTSHDFALMQDEVPGEASGVERADPASQQASDFAPDDASQPSALVRVLWAEDSCHIFRLLPGMLTDPSFDIYDSTLRPSTSLATITNASSQDTGLNNVPSPPPAVPNFSVPKGSNRRFSAVTSPPRDSLPDREVSMRPLRRSPPPVLGISRPLSIVLDQSPKSPHSSNTQFRYQSPNRESYLKKSASQAMVSPRQQDSSTFKVRQNLDSRARRTSLLPKQLSDDAALRKYSSTSNLGAYQEQLPQSQVDNDAATVPQATSQPHIGPDNTFDAPEDIPRAASSTEEYRRPHKPLTSSNSKSQKKRASFGADTPSFQYSLNSYSGSMVWNIPLIEEPVVRDPQGNLAESAASSTKAVQVPSRQRLAVDARTRTLSTSRSMPTLEGPPPLPPPNRALPAIPKKQGSSNAATTAPNVINV
ncbi:hypothetical protein DL762_002387 [Monosporascus cannonballus]|uniref:PH domain-containing protein n=1 Tax=Monosporascus cannonballus TaxID=155416 RepID=A0ABY0HHS9_9PEZI|nr:hypothetical protein DL762_002387 [Monosporascus cannonballus]